MGVKSNSNLVVTMDLLNIGSDTSIATWPNPFVYLTTSLKTIGHNVLALQEAYFKILPHLEMKHSNIESIFIPTGFQWNRSKFLKQITEDEAKHCPNVINIDNKDGYYTEAPSMMDKYERRE